MQIRYWTLEDCRTCKHLKYNESLQGKCCELRNTADIADLFSTNCNHYNPDENE